MFQSKGCGLGLRHQHYPVITETWPKVDWFEAISENYMDTGGRPLHVLEKIRTHYPIALHGTALSIGSLDPLDQNYLNRLKTLVERIDPFIVSDHLCWSSFEGKALHDLLPLPYTMESIQHVVGRVQKVQEFLNRRILLENVSTYVGFKSEMNEWEFLAEVSKKSGAGILLDVNNVYVNSVNHQFDPLEYLKNLPQEAIGQIHLAGHSDLGSFLFDTHSAPIIESVWALYEEALKLFGQVSTLIEWDEHIPEFPGLLEEAEKAKAIYKHHRTPSKREGLKREVKLTPPVRTASASLQEAETWLKAQILREEIPQTNVLNPARNISERILIYVNGYPARIRESLKEVYEAVYLVLGDEVFNALAKNYARECPSKKYNLNYIGSRFPEFLKQTECFRKIPFVSDLAKLEWAIWKAFHAFDEKPMNSGMLQAITPEEWEKLVIKFQPSVGIIASQYSVFDLWRYRKDPGKEASFASPQNVLVGRKDDQVRCELLNSNQCTLLEGLLSGKTLGEVCETLSSLDEEIPIASWFSNWVQDGLILSCEPASSAPLDIPKK